MSTRSSIYYHNPEDGTPTIHIYWELMRDPTAVRMEIDLPGATVNIELPPSFRKLIGIVESPHA